jgi:S-DNA-T family DNA segregation ATPase FtsK/SpoIIIE
VLLVPPLIIGGAVYGLLPAHEDGAARSSALAIESLPADFNSRSAFDTAVDEPPPAVAALVSPATNAFVSAKPAMPAATTPAPAAAAGVAAMAAAAPVKPVVPTALFKPVAAAKTDAPANAPPANPPPANPPPAKPAVAPAKVAATPEPTTFALASEHSERIGKDATRVLGPLPVQVTVVVPPNAAETQSGEPVSLGAAPPSSIAALPPALADAPPAAPAASGARSSEPARDHRADSPHRTHSHFRHLARHKEARPDARPDDHATQPTQRAADPPQHDFSLRNLLQQQGGGGRQKNAGRG